jgi:hypothetical protein
MIRRKKTVSAIELDARREAWLICHPHVDMGSELAKTKLHEFMYTERYAPDTKELLDMLGLDGARELDFEEAFEIVDEPHVHTIREARVSPRWSEKMYPIYAITRTAYMARPIGLNA